MLSKLTSIIALGLTTTVGSTKLYMMNNTKVVPGTSSLLEYDTTTNNYVVISKDSSLQASVNDCIDAAVVCGNTWYGVWTDVPVNDGIVSIDLKTGKRQYLGPGMDGGVIHHALGCNNDDNTLYTLASKTNNGKPVTFHVTSYNPANGTATTITDLPDVDFAGFDNSFGFTSDGMLYAVFPNNEFEPKVTSGDLFLINAKTGGESTKYALPSDLGMSLGLWATADSSTFKGGFVKQGPLKMTNKLCDIKLSTEGEASVSNCEEADYIQTHSSNAAAACEDKHAYLLQSNIGGGPGTPQLLTGLNLNNGSADLSVDISKSVSFNYVGALACK